MEFLLEGESFENKLSLLDLFKKSKEGNEDALQLMDEFAILKCFPSTKDYDIVRSLVKINILTNETKTMTSRRIYKISYMLQRIVDICSGIPNGKTILTNIIGNLSSKSTNGGRYPSQKYSKLEIVHDKDSNFIHTAAVSFMALNQLKDITDVFPAIYAVFRCSDVVIPPSKITLPLESLEYCTHISGSTYTYMIAEKIEGRSFSDFINDSTTKIKDIYVVLCQIIGALSIAYKFGYKHNDLNTDMIYVLTNNTKETKERFSETFSISSNHKVKIISNSNASLYTFGDREVKKDEELSDVRCLLHNMKNAVNEKVSTLKGFDRTPKTIYFLSFIGFVDNIDKTFDDILKRIKQRLDNDDLFTMGIPLPSNILNKEFVLKDSLLNHTSGDPLYYLLYASYIDKLNYYPLSHNRISIQPYNGELNLNVINDKDTPLHVLLKHKAMFDIHRLSRRSDTTEIINYKKILDNLLSAKLEQIKKSILSGSSGKL